MCSLDYDPPSVCRKSEPIARSVHRCTECHRDIMPGEQYRRTFGVWEGHADVFKTCPHCCVGQDWLLENCNGFMHDGLPDEIMEHADEYPDIRFGMLRLCVGMRRRWRRFDGAGLMPVQPMPRGLEGAA